MLVMFLKRICSSGTIAVYSFRSDFTVRSKVGALVFPLEVSIYLLLFMASR